MVKHLAKTRIPIIKVSKGPCIQYPRGCSADVGFSNLLALHNTRLMATYAECDPRVRILIIFVKVWAKARKINNTYRFLIHPAMPGIDTVVVPFPGLIIYLPVTTDNQLWLHPDGDILSD